MSAERFESQGKADFTDVYNTADPRPYFRTLRPLDYQIPANAYTVFQRLLRARAETAAHPEQDNVLDVCCSYGVNAALLRCGLSMAELFDRYADPALAGLGAGDLAEEDRAFYAAREVAGAPRVLGLDVAHRAVDYAERVGLLDGGWGENLETDEPSRDLVKRIGDVGLIAVTGGVGYITESTFDRLVSAFPADRRPWVASFVLRMYSYEHVRAVLDGHGLVTEKLTGTTFRQRRFASEQEQTAAQRAVREHGLDPAGKEDEGWYHCDFFLSRPAEEAEARPLPEIITA